MTLRRRRSDNDITALFSLGAEEASENAVDRVHCLRSAAKSQYCRIGLCRIIAVWQDSLIANNHTAHPPGLFYHFRLKRLDRERRNGRHRGSQQHPLRALSLHLDSPLRADGG